jgi:hypothetical protein
MAIVATDLLLRLSGGAAESDPDNALGGVMSTTTVINPAVAEENLFNNVDGAEASAGSTKYRALYLLNNHGSITLSNSVVWLPTNTPSTDTVIAMALAGEGLNATMETVANEDTAPVGESFTSPATKGAGLSTGNVPFGQRYGTWYRRTVTAAASAFDNDDWAVEWEGDTTA